MSWTYAYTSHVGPSIFAVLLIGALGIYAWRRRGVPGVIPFTAACLFAALWAAGSVLEIAGQDVQTKIAWTKFQAVWQLPTVTAITCFILEYIWPGRWLTRRNLILLSIAPCLMVGMTLTDDLHHLIWRGFRFDGSISPQFGPGSWIAMAYAYGLGILNIVVLARLFLRSPQQRWPVTIMLIGMLQARVVYILDRTYLLQSDLPLDVLGNAFWCLIFAIALFGFRIFDTIPLARQTAIDQLRAGLMVLDPQGRVISLNPAARAILGLPEKGSRDHLIHEVLPSYTALPEGRAGETEISIPRDQEIRYYRVESSALTDWRKVVVGRLLMLHDVTEQKLAQAQIIEQERAVTMLREREHMARELHDELSQELSFINVQAQVVDDLLADGNIEQASAQLHRLAQIARGAQVDVRGQISKLSLDIIPPDGFVGGLRRFMEEFEHMYGIPAELILSGDPYDSSLKPTAEVQLMRIIQEAFTNVRKHARARYIRVCLETNLQRITLSIQDDGAGFTPNDHATGRRTFGLRIMAERAAEIGGHLEVHSLPGQGTRVVVGMPVKSER